MLSLTTWSRIIVRDLQYPETIAVVSTKIKATCLLSDKKFLGAYQVNQQKIWDTIIMPCSICRKKLMELKISSIIDMESWQTENEYQMMHLSARSAFKKIKR